MKNCLECENKFNGRVDAKFCSDQCRNAYNNRKHNYSNPYIRKVNSILRKNRRILEEMNPDGKTKMHKDQLVRKGFDFSYYTNTYTTKNGKNYIFCYEHGFLEIENNWLVLVKRKD